MSENCKTGAIGVSSVDVCTFLFSFRGNSSLKDRIHSELNCAV